MFTKYVTCIMHKIDHLYIYLIETFTTSVVILCKEETI